MGFEVQREQLEQDDLVTYTVVKFERMHCKLKSNKKVSIDTRYTKQHWRGQVWFHFHYKLYRKMNRIIIGKLEFKTNNLKN